MNIPLLSNFNIIELLENFSGSTAKVRFVCAQVFVPDTVARVQVGINNVTFADTEDVRNDIPFGSRSKGP